MKNKTLLAFVATLIVAGVLRIFIFDVISISNDVLKPQYSAGDFLLVSKISALQSGQWVLLKNYPNAGLYSVRRLMAPLDKNSWIIMDPTMPPLPGLQGQQVSIPRNKILGRVITKLWSIPPKAAAKESAAP